MLAARRLYVENLSYATTSGELRAFFSAVGHVVDARIIRERATGRPRGIAFVELVNVFEAACSIALLNGRCLGGRRLTICFARPRAGSSRW